MLRWQKQRHWRKYYKKERFEAGKKIYLDMAADTFVKPRSGMRAIHCLAANFPCQEMVPLVQNNYQLLLYKNKQGKVVMHFLACHGAAYDVVAAILNALNADQVKEQVNMECNFGMTPVMYAAKHGCLSLVKLFHEKGADLEHVAQDFSSLYHVASGNYDVITYISQYCSTKLALRPAKSCYYLPAVPYCVYKSANVLDYMIGVLKLPFDDSVSNRATWYRILARTSKYNKTLQLLCDKKVVIGAHLIKEMLVRQNFSGYCQQMLNNSPNTVLDSYCLFRYDSPIYSVICDHVKEPLMTSSWHNLLSKVSLQVAKELIQHSAPASVVPATFNLPIRDITFHQVKLCAFDEASLMRRLSRISPPVNVKRLRYFNGKTWTSSFVDWNSIPFRITLVEITLFLAIPKKIFSDITFQY